MENASISSTRVCSCAMARLIFMFNNCHDIATPSPVYLPMTETSLASPMKRCVLSRNSITIIMKDICLRVDRKQIRDFHFLLLLMCGAFCVLFVVNACLGKSSLMNLPIPLWLKVYLSCCIAICFGWRAPLAGKSRNFREPVRWGDQEGNCFVVA